ncbi:hypothetical protein KC686_03840 [Candidatus Woesebacteria bacterium]|nr:hypothetical protein [Candidatus Woesebacteria bacterium]
MFNLENSPRNKMQLILFLGIISKIVPTTTRKDIHKFVKNLVMDQLEVSGERAHRIIDDLEEETDTALKEKVKKIISIWRQVVNQVNEAIELNLNESYKYLYRLAVVFESIVEQNKDQQFLLLEKLFALESILSSEEKRLCALLDANTPEYNGIL